MDVELAVSQWWDKGTGVEKLLEEVVRPAAIRCARTAWQGSEDDPLVEDAAAFAVAKMLEVLVAWRSQPATHPKTADDIARYTCTISQREFRKLKRRSTPKLTSTDNLTNEPFVMPDTSALALFISLWICSQKLSTNEFRSLCLGPAPHDPVELRGLLWFSVASVEQLEARLALKESEFRLASLKLSDPELRKLIQNRDGVELRTFSISNWRSQAKAKLEACMGILSKTKH